MASENVRPDLPGEEWRPIPSYSDRYEVSSWGRIWSRISGRVLRLKTDRYGYQSFTFTIRALGINQTMRVHLIVARAFHGEPPGPVSNRRGGWTVNHRDRNKQNNRADNLEWMLHSENVRDGLIHYDRARGERTNSAVLNAASVADIRRRCAAGESTKSLARVHGVAPGTIRCVVTRRTWKHVA